MTDSDRVEMIRSTLESALHPSHIDIVDDSHLHAGHAGAKNGAGHFTVHIVADAFTGKSAIERHRMVYAALDHLMQSQIHALSIKAVSPEEI